MRQIPYFIAILSALTVISLSACVSMPAQMPLSVDNSNQFNLLGPDLLFDPQKPPPGWVTVGYSSLIQNNVSVSRRQGIPALKVVTGPTQFLLVRKLDADLVVSSHLDWFWSMDPHGGKTHPVKLVIGFDDSTLPSLGSTFGGFFEGLPRHNRTLTIGWSDLGIMAGHLEAPTEQQPIPLYTPRGGREQQGHWWRESVDLNQLFRKAWPGSTIRDVRLVFIGLLVDRHVPPTRAFISGLILTR